MPKSSGRPPYFVPTAEDHEVTERALPSSFSLPAVMMQTSRKASAVRATSARAGWLSTATKTSARSGKAREALPSGDDVDGNHEDPPPFSFRLSGSRRIKRCTIRSVASVERRWDSRKLTLWRA